MMIDQLKTITRNNVLKIAGLASLLLIAVLIIVLIAWFSSPEMIARERETGELRHELFVECMELAANINCHGGCNGSDIIEKCDSAAIYMSNHIK